MLILTTMNKFCKLQYMPVPSKYLALSMQVQQPTVEQARRTGMRPGQLFLVYFGDEQEIAAVSRDTVAQWGAKPGPSKCRDPRRPKAIKDAEAAISRGAAVQA